MQASHTRWVWQTCLAPRQQLRRLSRSSPRQGTLQKSAVHNAHLSMQAASKLKKSQVRASECGPGSGIRVARAGRGLENIWHESAMEPLTRNLMQIEFRWVYVYISGPAAPIGTAPNVHTIYTSVVLNTNHKINCCCRDTKHETLRIHYARLCLAASLKWARGARISWQYVLYWIPRAATVGEKCKSFDQHCM